MIERTQIEVEKCSSPSSAVCEPEGETVLQIHFEGYLAVSRSVGAGSFLGSRVVGRPSPSSLMRPKST